jgi:hypothetical protein
MKDLACGVLISCAFMIRCPKKEGGIFDCFMAFRTIKTNNLYFLIICGVAALSALLYAYLPTSSLFIFNSPDETANFFATESFYLYNSFGRPEPLNDIADNLIHPRSIIVSDGFLFPVSFLGLPLIYGFAAKIFGLGIVPFIIPIFSSFFVILFYFILKRIFNAESAFWSALFLAPLPPFLYFSNRGLFHNILFFDLLILFLAVAVFQPIKYLGAQAGKKKWLYEFGDEIWGAVILGFAFLTRPPEFLWLLPILAALGIIFYKNIRRKQFFVGLAILGFFAVIFLVINKTLYGGLVGSGYLVARGAEGGVISAIRSSLLPFGFNLRVVAANIWHYFFGLFPVFGAAYALGAVFFLLKIYLKDFTRPGKIYFLSWVWLSVFLFIYYGSGRFQDTPDPGMITPAVSYYRYWLPIYVFGLPIALNWIIFGVKIFSRVASSIVLSVLFLVYAVVSFMIVFMTPGDGLFDVRREILSYRDIIAQSEALIPQGSLIIVYKADKIFFPQWPVALFDDSDKFYDAIVRVRKERQVFYFRPGPTPKEKFYIYNKLAERNLVLTRVAIMGKNVLYEIR